MNSADVSTIVNGVVELAAIGAATAFGLRVADRIRVVNPVKQQQSAADAGQPAAVENLDERRPVA